MSRSGYYAWRARQSAPLTGRAARDQVLLEEIVRLHAELDVYGSPRIHQELLRTNVQVGRHRVARLMRENGIVARRGRPKTHTRSVPPRRRPEIKDLVCREFERPAPNMLWFSDLTMIRTGEGYLRAAVIIDACSRRVIGSASANHETPNTAYAALRSAINDRKPPPGCIIHTDRGYQFTSWQWLDIVETAGMRPSIGQHHNALDNATMESWFGSFKNEFLHPFGQPATLAEARTTLFRYIHFYNTRRLHSSLGYLSPVTYETTLTELSA